MKQFKVKNMGSGAEFTVNEGESVLNAALRQGVMLPYSCKNGTCGSCKGQLESGEVIHINVAVEVQVSQITTGRIRDVWPRQAIGEQVEVGHIDIAVLVHVSRQRRRDTNLRLDHRLGRALAVVVPQVV